MVRGDFIVVRNDEEQYAMWPAGHRRPPGWHVVGVAGDEQTCLAYVDQVWTDMRPASLQLALAYREPAGSLPELFETAASGAPGAVAVEDGDERVTYRDLHVRSGRLAARLRGLGVGAEDVVGVAVARSVDWVVAVLATIRSGAAWLPLDPDHPAELLRYMLADAGVRVVVDEGGADLGDTAVARIAPRCLGATVDASRPPHPEHVACVIYPSGSAERPAGATLTHAGLANLIRTQAALLRIDHTSRMLQFATADAGASVFELATVLSVGGTLIVAPRSARLDGAELVDVLRTYRITHALLPPSVLAALPEADLPDLRVVLVRGEAAPAELGRRWRGARRMVSAYGPTEVTIVSAVAEIDGGSSAPIGRLLPGLRVVLLGPDLLPVPAGEPGEIAIGGVGLARGYRGRPGLTTQRFVPDPTGGVPGSRLFRTGDLGRWRPDGQLDRLGRINERVVHHISSVLSLAPTPLWTEVAC